MKFDLIRLQEEIDKGNVDYQVHANNANIRIYKYTRNCSWERNWNEITTKTRGLVLDNHEWVLINSVPKFYNHTEPEGQEILLRNKDKSYQVFEKLDGSLIQATLMSDYTSMGDVLVTSSGSFESPQAIKGKELIEKFGYNKLFASGLSYIFEIIYAENRIVLDYRDEESLRLIAIRYNDFDESRGEKEEIELDNYLHKDKFNLVKKANITIEEIVSDLDREDFINKEGYVVKFENGDRVKFKYKKYVELHKIVSGINEVFCWEYLQNPAQKEVLELLPDELKEWFENYCNELKTDFLHIKEVAQAIFSYHFSPAESRKAFAEKATKIFDSRFVPLMFMYYDKFEDKKINEYIWDMIKPKNSDKLFAGAN